MDTVRRKRIYLMSNFQETNINCDHPFKDIITVHRYFSIPFPFFLRYYTSWGTYSFSKNNELQHTQVQTEINTENPSQESRPITSHHYHGLLHLIVYKWPQTITNYHWNKAAINHYNTACHTVLLHCMCTVLYSAIHYCTVTNLNQTDCSARTRTESKLEE